MGGAAAARREAREVMTLRGGIGSCAGIALALAVFACGSERGAKQGSAAVLAKVGSRVITQTDLDEAIAAFPRHEQTEYQSGMGRLRLLDQMVDLLLLVAAAEERGLADDPEVARRLQEWRNSVLSAAYRNALVEALPQPTEEDLHRYYDEHHEEFVVLGRVKASWMRCATQKAAQAARSRVVTRGEHFGTVARELSIDNCSKEDGGLLGYFNPGGYVRCIGTRDEFNQRVFELEAEDVSEVFEWDGTWAFVKVHEKTTERQETYSKARERIVARLRPQLSDSLLQAEMQRLRQRFKVDVLLDATAELADKSAEDLMQLATDAASVQDKIDIYRVLLQKYPHHEHADQAQFMIGFLTSENLQDYEAARREFQKLLDDYPDSDMRSDALYMLQNLGSPELPTFEESPPSDASGR